MISTYIMSIGDKCATQLTDHTQKSNKIKTEQSERRAQHFFFIYNQDNNRKEQSISENPEEPQHSRQ